MTRALQVIFVMIATFLVVLGAVYVGNDITILLTDVASIAWAAACDWVLPPAAKGKRSALPYPADFSFNYLPSGRLGEFFLPILVTASDRI